jgi:hypothetical protein
LIIVSEINGVEINTSTYIQPYDIMQVSRIDALFSKFEYREADVR